MPIIPVLNNSFGFNRVNNITVDQLIQIGNITEPMEFFSNVNVIIFNQLLFFILMWVMVAIVYVALQQFRQQPLINAMYATAGVTMIGFFMRAIETTINGQTYGLITDNQMWIFPILSIVLAA